jgi:hypothetical protein
MWIFDFQIDSFALSEKSPIYYTQKFPEYGRQAVLIRRLAAGSAAPNPPPRMYMGKFNVVFYGAQYVFSPTVTK